MAAFVVKMRRGDRRSCCPIFRQVVSRIPLVVLVLVLIFLWSSSFIVITGNIVHVCVSSTKLSNLYCLSAFTQPNVKFPASNITFDAPQVDANITIQQNNGTDYELELGKRNAEEQIRLQRQWVAKERGPGCGDGGIYVYDLPRRYNQDLLAQCKEMLPWMDFCKYLQNEAKGEAIPHLGNRWYNTHQYALEMIFHARVLNHPCRVFDEQQAKIFYVPYYGGMDILRWHFKNVSYEVKDSLGMDLVKLMKTKETWKRRRGKDHVLVLGKISWDFRRYADKTWGTRFLLLEEMQNPVKLLIERQPWEINDVGIPHPTFFHPKSDDDIMQWQAKVMQSKRKNLVSFAGAARPEQQTSIRSSLISQCNSSAGSYCTFLDCNSGRCDQPDAIIQLFLESEFCLQPPGDSPTRKSVFDSLVAGCIPVIFDPFTAYYQYAWHLPRLVYGDSDSKLEKFQDAFSIAVNNLLERVNTL